MHPPLFHLKQLETALQMVRVHRAALGWTRIVRSEGLLGNREVAAWTLELCGPKPRCSPEAQSAIVEPIRSSSFARCSSNFTARKSHRIEPPASPQGFYCFTWRVVSGHWDSWFLFPWGQNLRLERSSRILSSFAFFMRNLTLPRHHARLLLMKHSQLVGRGQLCILA